MFIDLDDSDEDSEGNGGGMIIDQWSYCQELFTRGAFQSCQRTSVCSVIDDIHFDYIRLMVEPMNKLAKNWKLQNC